MAVDTRDKRASSACAFLPFGRHFPVPDGTIDQGDRQQAAMAYRGILSDAPPVGPTGETRRPLRNEIRSPIVSPIRDAVAWTRRAIAEFFAWAYPIRRSFTWNR